MSSNTSRAADAIEPARRLDPGGPAQRQVRHEATVPRYAWQATAPAALPARRPAPTMRTTTPCPVMAMKLSTVNASPCTRKCDEDHDDLSRRHRQRTRRPPTAQYRGISTCAANVARRPVLTVDINFLSGTVLLHTKRRNSERGVALGASCTAPVQFFMNSQRPMSRGRGIRLSIADARRSESRPRRRRRPAGKNATTPGNN